MRDLVKATGLGLVVGGLLGAFFYTVDLTPMKASAEAAELDVLLRTYLAIAGVIFGLVVAFVAYSVVVFRRRDAEARGATFRGHRGLERGWLIVTTALVLASALDATLVLNKVMGPRVGYAQPELEITATGHQWEWAFAYPAYGITTPDLVLEKDRPTLVHVISIDVVHSLFIPEFRVKFDAVPGLDNQMRVVPTELGAYQSQCAALCGVGHSKMIANVRVLDSPGFSAWASEHASK
jgi:cytochrome c oxidase subunit II